MRISGINSFNIYQNRVEINQTGYKFHNSSPVIPNDSVSFSSRNGSISSNSLKAFADLGLPDIYTGKKMLTNEKLLLMEKLNFFEGKIPEVVKKLTPYKEYLEPVELEIFEKIEQEAETNPHLTLEKLFNKLYIQTRLEYRKIQQPYFDEINRLSEQLPKDQKIRFDLLRAETDKKLNDEPVIRKFSAKEFHYQIQKLTENLQSKNLKNRINNLSSLLLNEGFRRPYEPLAMSFVKKVYNFSGTQISNMNKNVFYKKYLANNEWDKDSVKIKILDDIKILAKNSNLKAICKLCEDNQNMVSGIPVYIPFRNKVFTYDLSEIIEDIHDKALKSELLNYAIKLPTSSTNAEALLLKLKDSNSNTIGRRLFEPSLASIEHLKPRSEGGKSEIRNYVLARKAINSKRGSTPLAKFLKEEGYPAENLQKYADKLIELSNNHHIKYSDTVASLRTLQRESDIKLDISNIIKRDDTEFVTELKNKYLVSKNR